MTLWYILPHSRILYYLEKLQNSDYYRSFTPSQSAFIFLYHSWNLSLCIFWKTNPPRFRIDVYCQQACPNTDEKIYHESSEFHQYIYRKVYFNYSWIPCEKIAIILLSAYDARSKWAEKWMVSNVLKRGLGALNYDRVCQSPGIITFAFFCSAFGRAYKAFEKYRLASLILRLWYEIEVYSHSIYHLFPAYYR